MRIGVESSYSYWSSSSVHLVFIFNVLGFVLTYWQYILAWSRLITVEYASASKQVLFQPFDTSLLLCNNVLIFAFVWKCIEYIGEEFLSLVKKFFQLGGYILTARCYVSMKLASLILSATPASELSTSLEELWLDSDCPTSYWWQSSNNISFALFEFCLIA